MASCSGLRFKIGGKKEQCRANLLEANFLKNGGMLLEETIASCDGKCKQPIRTFSLKDLQEATNNFNPDRLLHDEGSWQVYKGILVGNRPVYVEKYHQESTDIVTIDSAFTDIVIGLQMSAHNNVLKLIGCCVESVISMVYQFVADWFTLEDYILARNNNKGLQPLPWKSRIKIAMSTANSIAYLHTALGRPVVHRDIKPSNILMDGNMIPKLYDFSLSVSIPEGETHVETYIAGTYGYVDPMYLASCLVNESSDVYGFGVLLLMLLTAKKAFSEERFQRNLVDYAVSCIENDRFKECLDPSIVAEESSSWLEKEAQIYKFRELALKCVSEEQEDRPTMIEVGKEVTRIDESLPSLVN